MRPGGALAQSEATYLQVAVDVPLRRTFLYRPPNGLMATSVEPGMRVLVPFGRGQRVAVVVATTSVTDVEQGRIKTTSRLLDDQPIWSPAMLSLLNWAAEYYHHPIGEVIAAAMPVNLLQVETGRRREPTAFAITALGRDGLGTLAKSAPAQARVLQLLSEQEIPIDQKSLDGSLGNWRPAMRALLSRQFVEQTAAAAAPGSPAPTIDVKLPTLSPTQQQAVSGIVATLGRFCCSLLDGVTGSGKTEVYLRVIAECLGRGSQALLLVPEIGLTAQTVGRFRARFGDRICVIHSGLNDGERARAFEQARQGEASIVIGTRSAVWTPMRTPGVIIVDEEHDLSYKQQDGFRYSARDVAVMRAQRESIPIVLGSATPSLESLANVAAGRYRHIELPLRAGGAVPPTLMIMDIRGLPLQSGISDALLRQLDATVAKGDQAIVFINRRGYAPSLLCHACGVVSQCRRCDARMTVHDADRQLCCHHCGAMRPIPRTCEGCGSGELLPLGQGTERVAGLLSQRYGANKVVRIDRDTTRRRGQLDAALDLAHSTQASVLVGTQMLAKGHHFPGVTLAAVVDADAQLFSVDLRAGERLAQLLVQVAGRAGRGERHGQVIVQTHHPDHPLFRALPAGGYPAISATLLQERRATALPPFAFLAMLRAESMADGAALSFLQAVADHAHSLQRDAGELSADPANAVEILGPLPAPMARRAGFHRAQLLLQSGQRRALHQLLDGLLPQVEAMPAARRVRWSVDVDPAELF